MSKPSTKIEAKFNELDVSWLLSLMESAEKRKWKAITKEINRQASKTSSDCEQPGARVPHKNISPTYVTKQFHNLFGMPQNSHCYGLLGSSLPYAVAVNGWNGIDTTPDSHLESPKFHHGQ